MPFRAPLPPSPVEWQDYAAWPAIQGVDPVAPVMAGSPTLWTPRYGAAGGRPCWVVDSATLSSGAVVDATCTGPWLPVSSPRTGVVGSLSVTAQVLSVADLHLGVGPTLTFGDGSASLWAVGAGSPTDRDRVHLGASVGAEVVVMADIPRPASGSWHLWRWDVTAAGTVTVWVDGTAVATGEGMDLSAIDQPRWAVGMEGVSTVGRAARGWAWSGIRITWG